MKQKRSRKVNQLLAYFYEIKGKSTLSCMHNREPNREPARQTKKVFEVTGKMPAIWSGDFLFREEDIQYRQCMIEESIQQYQEGSLVHLMLHVAPPHSSEVCEWEGGVQSHLSDKEWEDLITPGGHLNSLWKQRLDIYCEYFEQLKKRDIPVMFRPFHEMNQKLFWWGGRKGKQGTAALYRLTRDYLEDEKGLDNIIWIWDMQDFDYEWDEYNPGDDYWDIFAVDFYEEDRFIQKKYETAKKIAGDKLMVIGECDVLPTPEVFVEQPDWIFYMSWSDLTFRYNTQEEIKTLYTTERIINRDKLLMRE